MNPGKSLATRLAKRRAFSLVEVLIALTITSALLTATLVALDASFKSYKVTTDAASNHVVSRIVMHRVLGMIRTGQEFGPFPANVLDSTLNPLNSNFVEFETRDDPVTGERQIVRLERRTAANTESGPFELWYVESNFENGDPVSTVERPLVGNVVAVNFQLLYDVGPRLMRATVDLTIRPNELKETSIGTDMYANNIRLVSSVTPRRLDEVP
ncbi:MAG: prepilin-type N-terminal cleavage/methylation domain-containing protein [Planctomycetota bacterium]|nr:prepilin-type N-terminal cleavage/methylation domain-containing protein [Planctomycetota bacterium]